MKKVLVILVLTAGATLTAIGAWRVATGRGLWTGDKQPAPNQAKQPASKQDEVKPEGAKRPEIKEQATKSVAKPDKPIPRIPDEALKAAQTDANIVALISDYIITKDEFEKELIKELRPYDYGGYTVKTEPAEANGVLMRMVAEKAMMIEGRNKGVLQTDMIFNAVKGYREKHLVNRLMQQQVVGNLTASEQEIADKMKADPKPDRPKAEQAVKREKANMIMSAYYADIYEKSNVIKATANFSKAVQIYQRLLLRPIAQRNVQFIRNSQIKNELTQAEKDVVMATFKGGRVTLKDWFDTIGEIAPPSRPRDLNTEAGVGRLLDRALRTPVLVAEATRLRINENEALKKQVRDYEDQNLLGDAKQHVGKQTPEPNDLQIKAYFDENQEEFRQGRKLKVDQIWCINLKAAQAAKAEIDDGKDFSEIKQKHSLNKDSKITDIYPNVEAYFWPEIWKGEPNSVVGPIKGMNRDQFNWRLVKILEKNPGEIPQFSGKIADRVKRTMQAKQRTDAMQRYRTELLEKYTHKIYHDRIKDINPLDIP